MGGGGSPGDAYTDLVGRWTPPGELALVLGLGVHMSLFPVTLLVPVLLLRPRPYEDMPRSAFASVLVVPMVLFVGSAAAVLQGQRGGTGRGTCIAWAATVSNVLCLAWSIFRDRFMTD